MQTTTPIGAFLQYRLLGDIYAGKPLFDLLAKSEKFVSTRYEDKRWIPRNGTSKPSSIAEDHKNSEPQLNHGDKGRNNFTNNIRSAERQRNVSPPTMKINTPVASNVSSQVTLT